jgi:hypothetical protein
MNLTSRDSSVGTVTRLWDYRGVGVRFPAGQEIFLSSVTSRSAAGATHSPIQWGVGDCFPGVKQQGSEADHLHLVLRLRMVEIYLHSPIPLHVMVLN